jgi:hypothetical protein
MFILIQLDIAEILLILALSTNQAIYVHNEQTGKMQIYVYGLGFSVMEIKYLFL